MSSVELPVVGPHERLTGILLDEAGDPTHWLIVVGPRIFPRDTLKNHRERALLHNAVLPSNMEFNICLEGCPALLAAYEENGGTDYWVEDDLPPNDVQEKGEYFCVYVRKVPVEHNEDPSFTPPGGAPLLEEVPPRLDAGGTNVN